jgi:hypothetical protein
MNKLEEKATELVAIAKMFGLEAQSHARGNEFVDIRYTTDKANIYTLISYTETNRVKVETWERNAGKTEKVATKYLGELFAYVAASEKRHAEKADA